MSKIKTIVTGNYVKEEVLCGCVGFRMCDLESLISAEPTITFEAMQLRTGMGQKCTACMLDLEYHFIRILREGGSVARRQFQQSSVKTRLSFKRYVYQFLDGLSPMVPIHLENMLPVFYSPTISQFLWISNYTMLKCGMEGPKTVEILAEIRDHAGVVVQRFQKILKREESLRENISVELQRRHLPSSDQLNVGSVRVTRKFRQPDVRGTTRPQVEVVGTAGVGVLHGQALAGKLPRWFTLWPRRTVGRYFLSLVNGERSRQLKVTCSGPYRTDGSSFGQPKFINVKIRPSGSELIDLSSMEALVTEDCPFSITWASDGLNASHIVSTDWDIERLSLDHP